MAAKRVDPVKAKEAKQKKIAIGGAVVLCLLFAIQGPKTLKMLKGPEPTAPVAASAAPNPSEPVPGAPAPADGADPAPAAAQDVSSLVDSDLPPVAVEGQLVSFERFASKDPFVPQAVVEPLPPVAPAADGDAEGDRDSGEPGGGSAPVAGGFTPAPDATDDGGADGAAPDEPAPRVLASDTTISINGTPEAVEVESSFPADQPTFVLVSLAKDGKSVEIGIAGGTYADGGDTIELKLGKPVTLQNTADGTRYELELIGVEGFLLPKPK